MSAEISKEAKPEIPDAKCAPLAHPHFCLALKSDLPTSPPIIGVSAVLLAMVWVSRRFVRDA